MLFAFLCLTYFICYPYLILQSIELFSCSKVGAHLYMTLNLNTVCWDTQHWTNFVSLGVAGLLIYVLVIPLTLVLCMRSKLHSYQKDLVLRFMFGLFTAGYPDLKYYLYSLVFARNLVLAVISGLFMKDVPSYVVSTSHLGCHSRSYSFGDFAPHMEIVNLRYCFWTVALEWLSSSLAHYSVSLFHLPLHEQRRPFPSPQYHCLNHNSPNSSIFYNSASYSHTLGLPSRQVLISHSLRAHFDSRLPDYSGASKRDWHCPSQDFNYAEVL